MKLFANIILREYNSDCPLHELLITHGSRIDDVISDMKKIAERDAKHDVEIIVDTDLMDDDEHECLKYSSFDLWRGVWVEGANPPVMLWTNMVGV